MIVHRLVPSSPGFYAEWPTLVGAPTAWEAVAVHDAAYVAATAVGQRQSFGLTLPPLASDDRLSRVVLRGYAAIQPPSSITVPNAGFELATDWTLGSDCDVAGTAYTSTNPHTGTRCMQISSRLSLGLTTCGYFEQSIPGFQVGMAYRVKLWRRSTGNSLDRNASVIINIAAPVIGTITGNTSAGAWEQFTCMDFIATLTTHSLRVSQTPGSSSLTFTRAFDDITIDQVASDGQLVPFYRLFGQVVELPPWTIPAGTSSPILLPDVEIASLSASGMRDGAFEIGVRNAAALGILDQLELDVSVVALRERAGFVGGRRGLHVD